MRAIIVTVCLVLFGGGIAVAAGTLDTPESPQSADTPALLPAQHTQESAPPQPPAQASGPDRDATKHFTILKRIKRSGDSLPADSPMMTALSSVDTDKTRLARADKLGSVRIVPAAKEVCVSTIYSLSRNKGASENCAPTTAAEANGVYTVIECSAAEHPQRRYFSGVAPDEVQAVHLLRRGQLIASVPVEHNGFSVQIDEPVDSIDMVGAGGARALPPVAC